MQNLRLCLRPTDPNLHFIKILPWVIQRQAKFEKPGDLGFYGNFCWTYETVDCPTKQAQPEQRKRADASRGRR